MSSAANPGFSFVGNFPPCLQKEEIPPTDVSLETEELFEYLPKTGTIYSVASGSTGEALLSLKVDRAVASRPAVTSGEKSAAARKSIADPRQFVALVGIDHLGRFRDTHIAQHEEVDVGPLASVNGLRNSFQDAETATQDV